MVNKLQGPLIKYTSGAFPKYSETSILASNFKNVDAHAFMFILHKQGWMTPTGAPTKKAAADQLMAQAGGKLLWDLELLTEKLKEIGDNFERAAVNQTIRYPADGQPRWANLGTIATYFSVSANEIGKWLDALGLRDDDKEASELAMEQGLAIAREMATGQGKNKTRKIFHWNLHAVQELLIEHGHYMDFDYEASLKGKGKNSDVKVESLDDVAKAFAKKFTTTFKDPKLRKELPALVKKTPKPIVLKAEELMKRPGFISTGKYTSYFDRA